MTAALALGACAGPAAAQQWDLAKCQEAIPANVLQPANKLGGPEIRSLLVGKAMVSIRPSPRAGDPGYLRTTSQVREDGSFRPSYEASRSRYGPWQPISFMPTRDGQAEPGRATVGVWKIAGNQFCTETLNTNPRCYEIYRADGTHFLRQVSGATACQGRIDIKP